LEGPVGGIDGDGDWTVFGAFGGEIVFRAGLDFSIASKTDSNTLGGIEFAGLVIGNIWIVGFVHEFAALVVLDVVEGVGHETSIAGIAGGNAVDKVLFREAVKFAGFGSIATFSRLDGGEGPAGTALSLILDGIAASFFTPVDGISISSRWGALSNVSDSLESEHGFVFSWGHGSELVHGNSESTISSIVFLDKALVGKENSKAGLVFITSEELIALAHP